MFKRILRLIIMSVLGITLIGGNTTYAVTKSAKRTKSHSSKVLPNKNVQGQKVTVLYYCDADNDLESDLMKDIIEMKKGYVNNPNLNLVALVDRAPNESNNSTALGENFEDTRLYKIEHNKTIRLSGGKEFPEIRPNNSYEANMGNANTLKKFIEFGKAHFKADKYILIMSNHGGGAKNIENTNKDLNKAICWDDSSSDGNQSDCLYMGEISDVLSNKHSVDVLAFDACLMGTAEVAYQYRPNNGGFSVNTMIASSPVVWGAGFRYDNIFARIKTGNSVSNETDSTLGGKERCFDPATITNEQLGALFVEEQRDSVNAARRTDQQLSCYDLNKTTDLKVSFDKLATNLSNENKKSHIENLRGSKSTVNLIHYFNEKTQSDWIDYPYFDIYDFCEKISTSPKFSKTTRLLAFDVMNNVDAVILYSFGGTKFNGTNGFKEGKNGLSVFLPDGKRLYTSRYAMAIVPHWQVQRWYNSINTMSSQLNISYGKLSWCKDGQDPRKNTVGNWFELLDSWFDKSNGIDGGYNHYQW